MLLQLVLLLASVTLSVRDVAAYPNGFNFNQYPQAQVNAWGQACRGFQAQAHATQAQQNQFFSSMFPQLQLPPLPFMDLCSQPGWVGAGAGSFSHGGAGASVGGTSFNNRFGGDDGGYGGGGGGGGGGGVHGVSVSSSSNGLGQGGTTVTHFGNGGAQTNYIPHNQQHGGGHGGGSGFSTANRFGGSSGQGVSVTSTYGSNGGGGGFASANRFGGSSGGGNGGTTHYVSTGNGGGTVSSYGPNGGSFASASRFGGSNGGGGGGSYSSGGGHGGGASYSSGGGHGSGGSYGTGGGYGGNHGGGNGIAVGSSVSSTSNGHGGGTVQTSVYKQHY